MAYCAVYGKQFPSTEPCPHCAWRREMENADPREFHWAGRGIMEFRGKWYWTDETEDFGNYEGCATQEEAERQQEAYAQRL